MGMLGSVAAAAKSLLLGTNALTKGTGYLGTVAHSTALGAAFGGARGALSGDQTMFGGAFQGAKAGALWGVAGRGLNSLGKGRYGRNAAATYGEVGKMGKSRQIIPAGGGGKAAVPGTSGVWIPSNQRQLPGGGIMRPNVMLGGGRPGTPAIPGRGKAQSMLISGPGNRKTNKGYGVAYGRSTAGKGNDIPINRELGIGAVVSPGRIGVHGVKANDAAYVNMRTSWLTGISAGLFGSSNKSKNRATINANRINMGSTGMGQFR